MRETVFREVLEGVTIERVARNSEYTMPSKHLHMEYEIYYLLNGEGYYFIEKETYHIKKGSLVLIGQGLIHKTSYTKDDYHDRILIELKEDDLESFFLLGGSASLKEFFEQHTGVFEFGDQEQAYVERILFGIAEEIQKKQEGYEWMVKLKLTELLILIMRNKNLYHRTERASYLTNKHKKVQQIADYITNHYKCELSLNQLCQQFYVSKFYLSRVFKEVTGFSVTEYINILRVKKAKELLEKETLNITEISECLGYDSITYFEKVFKRYTQNSPLKYRKDYLQKKKSSMRVI